MIRIMIMWSVPIARHPGVWNQVGLKKHYYKQSQWRWWNSSSAIQILKDGAVNVLHWTCQQSWKTQCPQDWERSPFIPIPQKGNFKERSNKMCLLNMVASLRSKFFKLGFNSTWTCRELPDVQAMFRKGRGARDQIVNMLMDTEKAR